jgi:hypothetical protein
MKFRATASLKFIVPYLLFMIAGSVPLPAQVKVKTFNIRCNIVSDDGEPIPDVAIKGDVNSQKELGSGLYSVTVWDAGPGLCCVLRFSRDGYQPVTKAIGPNTEAFDVVLKRGDTKWMPPEYFPGALENPVGDRMKLSVPANTAVTSFHDDYWTVTVSYPRWTLLEQAMRGVENDEQMQIVSGALWGGSIPRPDLLASSVVTIDRDMMCGNAEGSDIRGQTRDGKKWRCLWIFNETIRYKGASPEAATFFDSIISSLRCDPNR